MTARRNVHPRCLGGLAAALAILAGATVAAASDHADPSLKPPPTQDAGLTGLFAFAKGGDLVVDLNIHRGLTSPPPYRLEDYEYAVHFDLHSRVSYDSLENRARYGGTVLAPEGISPDVSIRFRLHDDLSLQAGYPRFDGRPLAGSDAFPVYVGVRDDPFIFPRFFKKNVISMVVSIPFAAFPAEQQDWLLWGTCTRADDGKLIDHVGRANRTQLGRLDFLNTLPPSQHVGVLEKKLKGGQRAEKVLMDLMTHLPFLAALPGAFEYVLQIRAYDVFPDVMFFTTRFPPGFPNGRRLEDDVAGLTCAQGDCVLQELAFIEGHWPRVTVNDRPFLDDFPYLGEPWPEAPEKLTKDRGIQIFWLLVLLVLAAYVVWKRRRLARAETPYVRPYRPPREPV
jgi:Domain of unknown function (DUF4331)